MKKSLSTVLALVLALVLSIGCVGFSAAEEAAAPAGPVAYLMYADAAWAMPISSSIPAMVSESRSFIWQPMDTMW